MEFQIWTLIQHIRKCTILKNAPPPKSMDCFLGLWVFKRKLFLKPIISKFKKRWGGKELGPSAANQRNVSWIYQCVASLNFTGLYKTLCFHSQSQWFVTTNFRKWVEPPEEGTHQKRSVNWASYWISIVTIFYKLTAVSTEILKMGENDALDTFWVK